MPLVARLVRHHVKDGDAPAAPRATSHATTMRDGGHRDSHPAPSRPGRAVRLAVIGLLAASAVVHVVAIPRDVRFAGYLGPLLAVMALADIVLGVALATARGWAPGLVCLLAAVDAAGYLVSRAIGLPLAGELVSHWGSPTGITALVIDAATVAVTWKQARRALTTRPGLSVPTSE